MEPEFELVQLPGGVVSQRETGNREIYHPGIGPEQESRILHVVPHRLIERGGERAVVWDMGLGAGANATAWLSYCAEHELAAELHSFDITDAPFRFAIANADALCYPKPWLTAMLQLLATGTAHVGPVYWTIHRGDLLQTISGNRAIAKPDAIAFDPYSPKSNPGVWSYPYLSALRQHLGDHPCTFSSYSRSTAVRLTLLTAGFCVGVGPVLGGKEESTIAATAPTLLSEPLGPAWLERAQRSTRAGLLEPDGTLRPLDALAWQHVERQCGGVPRAL
jgi:hypothetical protein